MEPYKYGISCQQTYGQSSARIKTKQGGPKSTRQVQISWHVLNLIAVFFCILQTVLLHVCILVSMEGEAKFTWKLKMNYGTKLWSKFCTALSRELKGEQLLLTCLTSFLRYQSVSQSINQSLSCGQHAQLQATCSFQVHHEIIKIKIQKTKTSLEGNLGC